MLGNIQNPPTYKIQNDELDRRLTLQGQIQEFWIGALDPENPVPRGGGALRGGGGRGRYLLLIFVHPVPPRPGAPTPWIHPCTVATYLTHSLPH